MRSRMGVGWTPIQIMAATMGARITPSLAERSGNFRFSGLSSLLNRTRCTMGSM